MIIDIHDLVNLVIVHQIVVRFLINEWFFIPPVSSPCRSVFYWLTPLSTKVSNYWMIGSILDLTENIFDKILKRTCVASRLLYIHVLHVFLYHTAFDSSQILRGELKWSICAEDSLVDFYCIVRQTNLSVCDMKARVRILNNSR